MTIEWTAQIIVLRTIRRDAIVPQSIKILVMNDQNLHTSNNRETRIEQKCTCKMLNTDI